MDEDRCLVREAIRDFETAFAAAQTAACKSVDFNLLVAELRLIEDTNWDRELHEKMDELNLAHAYFQYTVKTARNCIDKLLIELQKDIDAVEAKPKPVEPDVAGVLEEHNKDTTRAKPRARTEHNKDSGPTGTEPEKARDLPDPKRQKLTTEETEAHNSVAPKETGEQNRDLPDPDPSKST